MTEFLSSVVSSLWTELSLFLNPHFIMNPPSPPRPLKPPRDFVGELPDIGLSQQELRDISEGDLREVFIRNNIGYRSDAELTFRRMRHISKTTARRRILRAMEKEEKERREIGRVANLSDQERAARLFPTSGGAADLPGPFDRASLVDGMRQTQAQSALVDEFLDWEMGPFPQPQTSVSLMEQVLDHVLVAQGVKTQTHLERWEERKAIHLIALDLENSYLGPSTSGGSFS